MLGDARGDVVSGKVAQMRVRVWQDPQTRVVWSIEPRPIRRAAGEDGRPAASSLPTSASVRVCLREPEYDRSPWARETVGHRSRLEGWKRQRVEAERLGAEARQWKHDDQVRRQVEAAALPLPRDTLRSCGLEPDMVKVASGGFQFYARGENSEAPSHMKELL